MSATVKAMFEIAEMTDLGEKVYQIVEDGNPLGKYVIVDVDELETLRFKVKSSERTWMAIANQLSKLQMDLATGEYHKNIEQLSALRSENEQMRAQNAELLAGLEKIAAGNPAKVGGWLSDVEMADIARATLAKARGIHLKEG